MRRFSNYTEPRSRTPSDSRTRKPLISWKMSKSCAADYQTNCSVRYRRNELHPISILVVGFYWILCSQARVLAPARDEAKQSRGSAQ